MNTTTFRLFAALSTAAFLSAIAAPAFAYIGQNPAPQAKISIDQARQIALKAHPGKITDEELEREAGGAAFATPSTLSAEASPRRSASTPPPGAFLKTRRKVRIRTDSLGRLQQTRPARCGAGFIFDEEAMTDARNDSALSKVPAVTLGFWIIKILCDHARRDRRRRGHDEHVPCGQERAQRRLSHRNGHFSRHLRRRGGRTDCDEKIQPLGLLDRDRRLDDRGHRHG